MSEFSADKARALAEQCEEDDKRAIDAPWLAEENAMHKDWRVTDGNGFYVCHLDSDDGSAAAIARSRNNLPAIAAQLRAACDEVERCYEAAEAPAWGGPLEASARVALRRSTPSALMRKATKELLTTMRERNEARTRLATLEAALSGARYELSVAASYADEPNQPMGLRVHAKACAKQVAAIDAALRAIRGDK